MIRSELCAIAGMTIPTFNSHRRNGDLPFARTGGAEWVDAAGRVWTDYTVADAARMIAARQMADAGVAWSEAAETLRGAPVRDFAATPEDRYRQGFFKARVNFVREDGGVPDYRKFYDIIEGSLTFIAQEAERIAAAYNAKLAKAPAQQIAVAAIVAADLGRALRIANMKSAELGIDVSRYGREIESDAEVGE